MWYDWDCCGLRSAERMWKQRRRLKTEISPTRHDGRWVCRANRRWAWGSSVIHHRRSLAAAHSTQYYPHSAPGFSPIRATATAIAVGQCPWIADTSRRPASTNWWWQNWGHRGSIVSDRGTSSVRDSDRSGSDRPGPLTHPRAVSPCISDRTINHAVLYRLSRWLFAEDIDVSVHISEMKWRFWLALVALVALVGWVGWVDWVGCCKWPVSKSHVIINRIIA